MRRSGWRLMVLAVAAFLALFGAKAAAETAETPAPTPAPTAEPTPAPTPLPREEDFVHHGDVGNVEGVPSWPFEWMEDFEQEGEAAAVAAAVDGGSAPVDPMNTPGQTPGWTLGGSTPSARSAGAGTAASEDIPAEAGSESSGEDGGSQGDAPQAPGIPASTPNATISESNRSQKDCQPQTIQNSIHDDRGAIVQTVVIGADCRAGASQVLLSYDIRGPPTVVLLVDSVGVNVDVEAQVSESQAKLHVGHAAPQGASVLSAAPEAFGPAGTGTAVADQTGDNRVAVSQSITGTSGDALSGTQTVRLHFVGDAGDVHVGATNVAPGASASTGNSSVSNSNVTHGGPSSSAGGNASSGQRGDNDVTVDQTAQARTGDALAGSQDIEVTVAGSVDSLGVDANNIAPGAVAFTGHATATNDAQVSAGPAASSADGAALSGQVGDNNVSVAQVASARSGDALAGTQRVTIVVGGSVGRLHVGAFNWSPGASAESGTATALNRASVQAGPSASSPGGTALSGQIGDNDVRVLQVAQAQSGIAAAGSQLIAIQIGGSTGSSDVQLTNLSPDAAARSGNARAGNGLDVWAGPSASGDVASTQQFGDNTVLARQILEVSSGDAVAGGQTVGSVSGWWTPAAGTHSGHADASREALVA